MKKITTLLFVSIAFITMYAQQPLNPSFENWSSADVGELPDNWDGTNLNVSGATSECVFKDDTDPQEGSYSVKLETIKKTVLINTIVVPGVITLGTINIDLTALQPVTISGGMPYTEKPAKLTGYYKFSPTTNDTAMIGIAFYSAGDTICKEILAILDVANDWTPFNIDLNYIGSSMPDTVNIICISSNNQEISNVGSILEIDNLKFVGGTVNTPQPIFAENNINITPNPAKEYVNITVNNVKNKTKILIYNTVGKLVFSKEYNSEINERIDISEFNSGIYFVKIINKDKNKIEKLIIK